MRASACRMGARYRQPLDVFKTVRLSVEFTTRRDEVIDYALVLIAELGGRIETICVYDSAHGQNEMHRYTQDLGKQPAEIFHHDTLGEGMRTAIGEIQRGYEEMIDGWRRG
ncbi:MAG: hypothetical protein ACJ76L_15230 [Conexibacter sp.]